MFLLIDVNDKMRTKENDGLLFISIGSDGEEGERPSFIWWWVEVIQLAPWTSWMYPKFGVFEHYRDVQYFIFIYFTYFLN